MAMWIKVLQQWDSLLEGTLPAAEITLLIQAPTPIQQTSVLQHPRVTVSNSRTPPPPTVVPAQETEEKVRMGGGTQGGTCTGD